MNYLFTDFQVLSSLSASRSCRAEELYASLCATMQFPLPLNCLSSALAVLAADGYVTIAPREKVAAHTTVTLTDKGQAAVAVSGLAKLLAGRRQRAMERQETHFCSLIRPTVSACTMDPESFVPAVTDAGRLYSNQTYCTLSGDLDGDISLTLYGSSVPYDGDGSEDDSAIDDTPTTVVGTADTMKQSLSHLLGVASAWLHESTRTRKVALHGRNTSLVVTFAYAVEENGDSVLRMSAAPIRFNRNRFIGKRDSDLDYAQCGDPVMSVSLTPYRSTLARLILPLAVSMPELLDDDMAAIVDDLHRALR